MLDLTSIELRKAADLKDQIAGLEKQLAALLGAESKAVPAASKPAKKNGGMSAAGRARIAAAVKLRWAKVRAAKAKTAPKAAQPVSKPAKKKFKMSAAAKAKLSAQAKARWAKIKAAGKKSL